MTTFLIFALAAVGTFGLRVAMVVGENRLAGVTWLQRDVALVSPAVLAAIVVSGLLVSDGAVSTPNPVVVAAAAAGAFGVHRSGNLVAALAAGLPVYWVGAALGLV